MPAIELAHDSPELEAALSEYATGDRNDRSEKTQYALLIKVQHSKSFFEFCRRYFDIGGMHFIEIGCGTAPISVAAALAGAHVSACDFVKRAVDLGRRR